MNLRFFPIMTVTLAATLFAQGPGPHRMAAKTDQVQSYLNLTDAQIQSLKQLHQSEMTAMRPIMEQMGPLHQSMRAQMEGTSTDATSTAKTVASIQNLRQQAAATRSSFRQQALAVLTADQRAKLAALESAMSLMPTVRQAMSLNLLTPPEGAEGGGPEMMDRPPMDRPE